MSVVLSNPLSNENNWKKKNRFSFFTLCHLCYGAQYNAVHNYALKIIIFLLNLLLISKVSNFRGESLNELHISSISSKKHPYNYQVSIPSLL